MNISTNWSWKLTKGSRYFSEHDFLYVKNDNQLQYVSSFHGILDLRQHAAQTDYHIYVITM